MNRLVVLPISAFSIGMAVGLLYPRDVTGQQEAETPTEEVSSTTDSNGNQTQPDETTGSPMEEDNRSGDEVVPDEPEPLSPAEEAVARSDQHYKNNELDEAIEDITEAIRLDPENVKYRVTRADLYFETQSFDKAVEDTNTTLASDPNNLTAHVLRGKIFENSGDVQKALTEFNAAVERNPTSWQALLEREIHFERQGQHDKALADADRITQLEPNSPTGYLSRATMHAASGEFEDAMKYSSAAVQQNPNNWFAHKMRGVSRAAAGDLTGAMEDFETALKLSPDNGAVLCARGTLYREMGTYDRSAADLARAADLEPRNLLFKVVLAEFLATCPDDNVRDGEKAAKYAAEALKVAPNEPSIWRVCAAAAAENGNFDEAVTWQERFISSPLVPTSQKRESQERLDAYRAGHPVPRQRRDARTRNREREGCLRCSQKQQVRPCSHFDL